MSDKQNNEHIKKGSSNSLYKLICAVILLAVFSVATGLIVHNNDKTSNSHAMMVSEAMQKADIKKASTTAAMKQEEADKMAAHQAMMNDNSSSTATTAQ
jgi:hypothetical protein